MENILLPSKVEFMEGASSNVGTAIITPCYHGYGTTLGNGLRRVLLSSLPGAAAEAFKIKGVSHEFSVAEGVREDVVEIILNLKQLAVKVFTDEPVVLTINKKGPGPVTAGDIAKDANVEVMNKDLVLLNLTTNKPFEMEITVGRGRGFKPVEEKDRQNYDLGTIVIDSIYTPIKDIGYKVENTRVGDITNFEKLTVNIETNGTISPQAALYQATQILMDHFTVVLNGIGAQEETRVMDEAVATEDAVVSESSDEEVEVGDSEEKKEKKARAKKTTKKK
ncbi:MAG: DNA-directed RNA polymerase subunit alpha [Candidatus Magasanikbacteria bacterium RIFOXYA2_FULL_44_8]|uniref:DNA-directed RNA polymerase subunit alpha n=1 Tax=Candidatus Magasanikbacteria bacterium RIFOXYA2_FULL_44_8 TaxID=1798696 RepID=A0A1F6NK11_9BACT|nr:MAG: DNA-directed RNA polymerase subunit alpha [Candidatus Magasanikbacteria bacterium RIFOXYA2_FULL_44_8]